ncbi:hypothetical protein JW949_03755 [Candidatus Woesearchaeota archaeon]|nr:hypothetical protein [Candidatus Woesearchaeota archaeon]
MTPTEMRFFREKVIKEYRERSERKRKKSHYNVFVKKIKSIMPINIAVGLTASIMVGVWKGWDSLVYLLLTGVIWITLISTLISALIKTK